MRLYSIFFFIVTSIILNANPINVEQFILKERQFRELNHGISLIPFTEVLVDSFRTMTTQQVTESQAFCPLSSFKFDTKYKRGRYKYWLKFSIENQTSEHRIFSFFCGNFDSLSIYKNQLLEDQFGKMVKGKDTYKNESQLTNASCILLEPGVSNNYLVSLTNSPGIPRYIEPIIISEKSLMLNLFFNSSDQWYILYFEFGALLIMGIFFLIQLYLKKSKLLFYYNLYLFFMLIHLSRSTFMNHPILQFYPAAFYDYFFYAIITMGVLISYISFIKQIIRTVAPEKKKLISMLTYIALCSFCWFTIDRILLLYDYSIAWKFSNIFHVVSMAFYLLVSIYFIIDKNQILKLIGAGTLLLNLFFLITIIVKICFSYTATLIATWINPATCLVVLIELFIFIIAMKMLDNESIKSKESVLQKIKKENDVLIGEFAIIKKENLQEDDINFLNHINNIIDNYMDNSQFNANQLYHLLATNHVTLNKKLKELTNFSAHQYIQQRKMEHSKRLVLHSSKSFSEIAYEIGLKDSTYFSKLFKKNFGYPPSHFRKQLAKHPNFQNLPS